MLLIILFCLLAVLSFSKKDNNGDVLILLFVLGAISIVLSRGSSDFPIYKMFYDKIEPLYLVILGHNDYFVNNALRVEFGFKILNSLFKVFTNRVDVVYLFCNFFILLIIYIFFRTKSQNFFKLLLPYFVFVFITTQVAIIRQASAIAVFFYSIQYITDKKFFNYFSGTFIGFLFHRSALFLSLLYFVVKKEYSLKTLVITFTIGMLLFLQVFHFSFLSLVNGLVVYLPASINETASFYIAQLKDFEVPSRFTLGIFENTGMFFLLLWMRLNMKRKEAWSDFMTISFNFSLLYIFIYIYFFEFTNIIYRINYYFIFFKFFIIVKYIEGLEIKNNKMIANFILVLYCGIMLIVRLKQPAFYYLWYPL